MRRSLVFVVMALRSCVHAAGRSQAAAPAEPVLPKRRRRKNLRRKSLRART